MHDFFGKEETRKHSPPFRACVLLFDYLFRYLIICSVFFIMGASFISNKNRILNIGQCRYLFIAVIGKEKFQKFFIYFCELFKIVNGNTFVDHMHGLPDKPELYNRAIIFDKSCVGCSARG